MNREIRFRAWDNGMVYQDEQPSLGGITAGDILKRFTTVMQFTGFHDRQGREIYEGDILRIDSIHYNFLYSVIWSEDVAAFELCMPDRIRAMGAFPSSSLEIIGNIYENEGASV